MPASLSRPSTSGATVSSIARQSRARTASNGRGTVRRSGASAETCPRFRGSRKRNLGAPAPGTCSTAGPAFCTVVPTCHMAPPTALLPGLTTWPLTRSTGSGHRGSRRIFERSHRAWRMRDLYRGWLECTSTRERFEARAELRTTTRTVWADPLSYRCPL